MGGGSVPREGEREKARGTEAPPTARRPRPQRKVTPGSGNRWRERPAGRAGQSANPRAARLASAVRRIGTLWRPKGREAGAARIRRTADEECKRELAGGHREGGPSRRERRRRDAERPRQGIPTQSVGTRGQDRASPRRAWGREEHGKRELAGGRRDGGPSRRELRMSSRSLQVQSVARPVAEGLVQRSTAALGRTLEENRLTTERRWRRMPSARAAANFNGTRDIPR